MATSWRNGVAFRTLEDSLFGDPCQQRFQALVQQQQPLGQKPNPGRIFRLRDLIRSRLRNQAFFPIGE